MSTTTPMTIETKQTQTVQEIANDFAARFESLTEYERADMETNEGREVDGAAVWYRPEDRMVVVFRWDGDDETWAEAPRCRLGGGVVDFTVGQMASRDAARVDSVMTEARNRPGVSAVRYWDEISDPSDPGWVVRTYEDGEITAEVPE